MGWRLTFTVIAFPSLCISLFLLLFVSDPPRGGLDKKEYSLVESVTEVRRSSPFCKQYFDNITNNYSTIFLLLQGIPGCIPWATVMVYLQDYLNTHIVYSKTRTNTIFASYIASSILFAFLGVAYAEKMGKIKRRFFSFPNLNNLALGNFFLPWKTFFATTQKNIRSKSEKEARIFFRYMVFFTSIPLLVLWAALQLMIRRGEVL